MQDMRVCTLCKTYVHEICIGLMAADKEEFACPLYKK
jgi:hypothetical protein